MAYEPKGYDVYSTQALLTVQWMVVAIEVINLVHEITAGHLHGQKVDLVKLLEGVFSIPFLLVSVYLFIRFKYAFSRQTSKNVVHICYLMLTENILNAFLRLVVGVKVLFIDKRTLGNMLLPVFFAVLWSMIATIACNADGNYNAPPGMLYMQQENEELRRYREY